MYDVIVIGAGPAGISASIYAKRAGAKVLVLYYGKSEIEKANKIDNYYGFVDGITGENLYNNGIEQAKKLGIEILEKEVTNIEINDNFIVKAEEKFEAKSLIIATGNKKLKPNIKGITEFEGKGISYCAICDGFFYKNKNVVVIGNGNFALNEADELQHIANSVKILTNGEEKPNTDKYEIDIRKIKEIIGTDRVNFIEFEDGEKLEVDGIFIAEGIAGGSSFAKKIGILTKDDNILVNENMQTNINGVFACGNLTGGLLQISKAVYEGAKAGIEATKYVKDREKQSLEDYQEAYGQSYGLTAYILHIVQI